MTEAQWRLEPHKVEQLDLDDVKTRAWMRANPPEAGVLYVNRQGEIITVWRWW